MVSTLNLFQAWKKSPDSLIIQAEQTFDCCGLGVMDNGTVYLTPNEADIKWSIDHKVFDNYPSAKTFAKDVEKNLRGQSTRGQIELVSEVRARRRYGRT